MMNAALWTADYASVQDGKLNVIGGGWTLTGPGPTPTAVAAMLTMSWDEAKREHDAFVNLVDADGRPVPDPVGGSPIKVQVHFGLPPAPIPIGVDFNVPLAIVIGPLQLVPGARYVWKLEIDGQTRAEWQAAFSVRENVAQAA